LRFDCFIATATQVTDDGVTVLRIDAFDEAISGVRIVQDGVSKLKSSCDVGFLRIDATPAKHQISQLTIKWINKYTGFMLENVIATLNHLRSFMNTAKESLDLKTTDAACKSKHLMCIMATIRDVRKKMETFEYVRHLQQLCSCSSSV
jgi:hypothetical protein